MHSEAPRYSAIVGCGPTGCIIANLIKQSSARAKLIAIADSQESLGLCEVDQKIIVKAGEKATASIGTFEIVFFVVDPTESESLTFARDIASRASADGAYTYGFILLPPGGGTMEALELRRSFDGMALIDSGWIMEKRGDNDPEHAIQIAFNFCAHALTFIAGAIDAGELSVSAFKSATSGKVAGFAASHLSVAGGLFSMTMGRINKDNITSGLIFVDDGLSDINARRIFVGIARGLPEDARLSMIRGKGLEPFKILAMLAH